MNDFRDNDVLKEVYVFICLQDLLHRLDLRCYTRGSLHDGLWRLKAIREIKLL